MDLTAELRSIDDKIISILQRYDKINETPSSELSIMNLIRVISENYIISEHLNEHFRIKNELLKQYYGFFAKN
jgi:hypothetical protein